MMDTAGIRGVSLFDISRVCVDVTNLLALNVSSICLCDTVTCPRLVHSSVHIFQELLHCNSSYHHIPIVKYRTTRNFKLL